MNGTPWGGSEELWFQTALYAAGKGYRVGCAFYDWEEKSERKEALLRAGCRVYLLSNGGRRKQNLFMRLQYKWSKQQATRMVASLPFKEFDLTVVNLGGFEIYTSLWKNLYHRLPRYVLLFHNYSEEDRLKKRQAARLHRWMDKAAGNFFAANRIRQVLEQKLDTTIPRADVVINPVTVVPSGQPAPYPALKPPFVFVMLAALDVSRKAQDNLIKALASRKWKDRPWKLLLYGKGDDHEKLQALITRLDMADKVELKGHIDNVAAVLQTAHLVLQITHRDAMPLAVTEAMAMARPLVVSAVGDMPQWVRTGENGWIAKSATVEEIGLVMEEAWQQREMWPLMGKRSFDFFNQTFPASPEQRFLQQLQTAMENG